MCQSEFALESNINLLAVKVGISPWEIRFRNAIEPGKALPNGQIADCSTALKETLLAVKDVYEQNADHAGIACAMKNSGVGVGLPDKGRCRLAVRNGVVELYSAASDIGQAAPPCSFRCWPRPPACPWKSSATWGPTRRWPPTRAPPPVPARP